MTVKPLEEENKKKDEEEEIIECKTCSIESDSTIKSYTMF